MSISTLYFGGSFNPIHHGHLICARAVAETAGYERIVLVPNRQPPHKQGHTDIAGEGHRLAMCQLAVAGSPLLGVDDIELRREGPSYTIDTVQQLRQRGEAEIAWLIGADMAEYLPHWHQAKRLLTEIRFVLMARPGWSFNWLTMPPEYRHLESRIVPTPLIDISSTDIRRRVAADRPITYMTPPAVVDYIQQHELYRAAPTAAAEP